MLNFLSIILTHIFCTCLQFSTPLSFANLALSSGCQHFSNMVLLLFLNFWIIFYCLLGALPTADITFSVCSGFCYKSMITPTCKGLSILYIEWGSHSNQAVPVRVLKTGCPNLTRASEALTTFHNLNLNYPEWSTSRIVGLSCTSFTSPHEMCSSACISLSLWGLNEGLLV